MKARTFNQLWEALVIDYLRSPKASILHDAFCDGRLSIKGNACTLVYEKYEKIKSLFKQNYFSNPQDFVLDRHKRAAIFVYSFLAVHPIVVSPLENTDVVFLYLANECIAFYFGLHSMTLDYKKEGIDRVVSENDSVFFNFPETHLPGHPPIKHFEENGYLASVCKDLYFSMQFKNYNILTMADKFFLLESNYCALKRSELYLDVCDSE